MAGKIPKPRRAKAGDAKVLPAGEEPAGNPLRIPESIRPRVDAIFAFTDPFCARHLDAEYGELIRKLVARLARKRPSPLTRGNLRIWAAAAIHVVGKVNFLSDPTQRPHLSVDQLSKLTGVPKSTMAGKSSLIRDQLGISRLSFEFCRREMLERNPLAWMISVDGWPVDVRMMPPEMQEEAWRRGLIPELPRRRDPGR